MRGRYCAPLRGAIFMDRKLLCMAALALSACTQSPPPVEGCARAATHEITWTNAEAPDVVTAASEGPTCGQAMITLSARNAAGDPLFVFASTHYALSAGDGAPPSGYSDISAETMDGFLQGLANVTLTRTSTLPLWREDAATLTESASTFAYETPFPREAYERMRELDLPMVCYASSLESTQCMIVDPASQAPAPIVVYGP
jgi:hypothetical protein